MYRANVKLDKKAFREAINDYDTCIEMMRVDGEDAEGKGRYPEYPDTFAGEKVHHVCKKSLTTKLFIMNNFDYRKRIGKRRIGRLGRGNTRL
jgi:hypothetical protein